MKRVNVVLLLAASAFVSGCSMVSTAPEVPVEGAAIEGTVHGGVQAIVGAHVYLLAAGTTGYGGKSVSLLDATKTGYSDSLGAYALTSASGGFAIGAGYRCTPNTQVYLYVLGGNTGAGTNAAASLMAVAGNCPATGTFATQYPKVTINEVTTVAAAYAIAGYATDATHVSSTGTTASLANIANAFATAANLADITTGVARTTTLAGNGVVPQAKINTMANILAACVNTTGTDSFCGFLLTGATEPGGTQPTETATAAIQLARLDGPVPYLYAEQGSKPPFVPNLTSAPNDFAIAIQYPGQTGNLFMLAVDGPGNIWTTNAFDRLLEFSPTGALLSGATGFTGGGLSNPTALAINASNEPTLANNGNGSISVFSSTGSPSTPAGGASVFGTDTGIGFKLRGPTGIAYTGPDYGRYYRFTVSVVNDSSSGSYQYDQEQTASTNGVPDTVDGSCYNVFPKCQIGVGAQAIANDASGNLFYAYANNTFGEFVSTTSTAHPTHFATYSGGGLNKPVAIAVDSASNIWFANSGANTVSKFNAADTALSSSSGYSGGGIAAPVALAIDGDGNVWTANGATQTIGALSNDGSTSRLASTGVGSPSTAASQNAIAIDGGGNIWVTDGKNNVLLEYVGLAAPVITPLPVAVLAGGGRP